MGFVFHTIASLIPLLCQGSFHDKSERGEEGLKKKQLLKDQRIVDFVCLLGGGN